MPNSLSPNARISEIISLARPDRPAKLPESLTAAALEGDIEGMELFLQHGADLEQRAFAFTRPLIAACSAGQADAVRWLIAHGAELDPKDATTSPIQAALGKGYCDIAAILLDAGLPLEKAAWGIDVVALTGNEPMLRWLVGRGIELDRPYPGLGVLRERGLKLAEKNGRHELAALLRQPDISSEGQAEPPRGTRVEPALRAPASERGALLEEARSLIRAAGPAAATWKSVRKGSVHDELLISYAALIGLTEVVRALLDAGADPDYAPGGSPTPLYSAAEGGNEETIKLLLERGASPNGADGKSWLPLIGALMSGNPAAVRMLIAAGAKTKVKPAGGRKLAEYARGPYASELLQLLKGQPKSGAKVKEGKKLRETGADS